MAEDNKSTWWERVVLIAKIKWHRGDYWLFDIDWYDYRERAESAFVFLLCTLTLTTSPLWWPILRLLHVMSPLWLSFQTKDAGLLKKILDQTLVRKEHGM